GIRDRNVTGVQTCAPPICARAGDHLRPQHPPGGERIMKRTAGPVAGALKILFVLLYGVPLVWIVLTSLKNRSDMFEAGSAFLFRSEERRVGKEGGGRLTA